MRIFLAISATLGVIASATDNTVDLTSSSLDVSNDEIENLEDFMQGLLTGALEVSDPIAEDCVKDGEDVLATMKEAIHDIEQNTKDSVKEGVQLIGQAIQEATSDMAECALAVEQAEKLEKMAESLSNPWSFVWHAGKNIVVNHVEIQQEIDDAIDAWYQKDYYQTGYSIGEALAAIFVPDNLYHLEKKVQSAFKRLH
uniref:Uncharacterized protein n=1 Tax=Helicotheca tamesis TaxID=374047 RepID=A0A7S2HEC7_9STRA|eukprot:CAMPEP_0185723452 /NCGR_PEP_ID=MMETSP1171-20130828/293_1 /TAXON_ID=374046 /ORGANISM="Helicotheca tamensis, Strain CCMP826" /LENGTH=197 /DNA_ID=CAMNT_0028391155 /DNA_START=73 /DNA_END=666 /DNA_ORIENTATION=+